MHAVDGPEAIQDRFSRVTSNVLTMWHDVLQNGQVGDRSPLDQNHILACLRTTFSNKHPLTPHQLNLACFIIQKASPQMEARGVGEAWAEIIQTVLDATPHMSTPQQRAMLYHNHARVLLTINHYRAGEIAYRHAIRLSRQTGDQFNEARACSNLGYYYIDRGHWWRAEVLSRQALTVFESIGNDYGVSRTQNHLGLLYLRQKRWDESKKALDDAIQTSKENGDSFGLMIEYMNYGLLNFGMGKGQETINWSEKAVNLARILEDVFSQGRIRNNVALGYRLEGKYDEAMTILKDVIALCQNHFDVIGTARAHLNIGEIHLLQGKQKLGMQHLDIAFETFSQINNADALVEILNFLTDYQIKYDQIDLAKETLSRLESVIENHHWGEERSKILQQQIRDYQLRLN